MEMETNERLVEKFEQLCKELPARLNGDVDEERLRMRAVGAAYTATKQLRSTTEHAVSQVWQVC